MLHSFIRLSRLTLAVALLFVWLISTDARTIQDGLRHLVDRKDRRDLSLFQIDWRIIERWLVNAVPIRGPCCVYQRYQTVRSLEVNRLIVTSCSNFSTV
jgi:hypothetical protein